MTDKKLYRDPTVLAAWSLFVQEGNWIHEVPPKPGRYFLRTQQGGDGGIGVVYLGPSTKKPTPVFPWGGDWWSLPIPPLPGVHDG